MFGLVCFTAGTVAGSEAPLPRQPAVVLHRSVAPLNPLTGEVNNIHNTLQWDLSSAGMYYTASEPSGSGVDVSEAEKGS